MITLYDYLPSQNAYKVRLLLSHLQQPYRQKFVSIFERFDRLSFVGHTHVPGVFLEGPDFYSPDELD